MVRLCLSIKAELLNVTNLAPASDDFDFFFQVKCNSCQEIHPKWVTVNPTEEHELSGSKDATAHFVWRCGQCKRESSAKFSSGITPYSSQNAQFEPFLVMECRGLEFIGFDPKGIWKCNGTANAKSSDGEFQDGNQNDSDDEATRSTGTESSGKKKGKGNDGDDKVTKFTDVDFDGEGEWTDYDDKYAVEVGMFMFESKWGPQV